MANYVMQAAGVRIANAAGVSDNVSAALAVAQQPIFYSQHNMSSHSSLDSDPDMSAAA